MLKTSAGINIRPVHKKDREKVISIVKATQFFRPNEILIAKEVFDDSVKQPEKDYFSFIAEMNGNVAGWICFGPVPCTIGTYDIYWVVVDPAIQRRGLGKLLVNYSQEMIKKQGGRLIAIETSGSSRYITTQKFYENMGYTLKARIEDFYAPQDDKVIYVKQL
jgi:ribosomal protein S18 acetylase RimI-like enzyme